MSLTRNDFLRHYRPYEEPEAIPIPEVGVGEEYESKNGDHISIVAVNLRKETIEVAFRDGRPEPNTVIPFSKFLPAFWTKIVRRTAYERLLDDDDV